MNMRHLSYKDVPSHIKKLMDSEGPTALAERTGVKRQNLYLMASGKTSPGLKTLQNLGVKLMVKP